ncbi:hypothetical protein Tco_0097623 [Tanacetum coccineum]
MANIFRPPFSLPHLRQPCISSCDYSMNIHNAREELHNFVDKVRSMLTVIRLDIVKLIASIFIRLRPYLLLGLKDFKMILRVNTAQYCWYKILCDKNQAVLKVSPWKGVVRFGKRGKLNLRYVGPFKVLKKVGAVAYKLELPQELSRIHNTFHVSNLKKCYSDDPLVVSLEGMQVDDKLHFVEEPVEIIDREVKQLRLSRVPIVKVQWNSRRGPEFTWERKDQFRKKYPHLFTKTAPSSSAVC